MKKNLLLLLCIFLPSGISLAMQKPHLSKYPTYIIAGEEYIWILDEANASKFCRSLGGHLPSAREIALYYQSLGAIGIIEFEDHIESDGSSLIDVTNSDGKHDHFYFNKKGYQPALDNGRHLLWIRSSSVFWSNVPVLFNDADADFHSETYKGNQPVPAFRCILE